MAGNSLGTLFRISNWGESHGKAVGVVVDGCPALLELSEKDIQGELDRRKPGQSRISTGRQEADKVEILSGVFQGKTTGAPIALLIHNQDTSSKDYDDLARVYRPGHADYCYEAKYGIRNHYGGGRSSARATVGHVAAGAIASKILRERSAIEILAYTRQIHDIEARIDPDRVSLDAVESNIVRCPDAQAAERMIRRIEEAQAQGDSVGGVVECVARNVPAGLGEPVFDKLNADFAKAMLLINAAKGFEIGSGFGCAALYGSQCNDPFITIKGKVATAGNHSGGVLGGISSGMPIVFRVAFKPTPSIAIEQDTLNADLEPVKLSIRGRHDPCIVPRAVPVVAAMTAIVLCDHFLRNQNARL